MNSDDIINFIKKNDLLDHQELVNHIVSKLKIFDEQEHRALNLHFIVNKCIEYAKEFDFTPIQVFNALESKRGYWYVNYYQEANFPKVKDLVIFNNRKEMIDKIKPELGFRCPNCHQVTKSPYQCNSGSITQDIKDGKQRTCNWKVFGLFRSMGTGIIITIKDEWPQDPQIEEIFMPISFEINK